jgi:hypothetical protein
MGDGKDCRMRRQFSALKMRNPVVVTVGIGEARSTADDAERFRGGIVVRAPIWPRTSQNSLIDLEAGSLTKSAAGRIHDHVHARVAVTFSNIVLQKNGTM